MNLPNISTKPVLAALTIIVLGVLITGVLSGINSDSTMDLDQVSTSETNEFTYNIEASLISGNTFRSPLTDGLEPNSGGGDIDRNSVSSSSHFYYKWFEDWTVQRTDITRSNIMFGENCVNSSEFSDNNFYMCWNGDTSAEEAGFTDLQNSAGSISSEDQVGSFDHYYELSQFTGLGEDVFQDFEENSECNGEALVHEGRDPDEWSSFSGEVSFQETDRGSRNPSCFIDSFENSDYDSSFFSSSGNYLRQGSSRSPNVEVTMTVNTDLEIEEDGAEEIDSEEPRDEEGNSSQNQEAEEIESVNLFAALRNWIGGLL